MESDWRRKEVAMAYFRVITRHLAGGTADCVFSHGSKRRAYLYGERNAVTKWSWPISCTLPGCRELPRKATNMPESGHPVRGQRLDSVTENGRDVTRLRAERREPLRVRTCVALGGFLPVLDGSARWECLRHTEQGGFVRVTTGRH
jgi:hypothetical protein